MLPGTLGSKAREKQAEEAKGRIDERSQETKILFPSSRSQYLSHSYKVQLYLSQNDQGITKEKSLLAPTRHSNKKFPWSTPALPGSRIQVSQLSSLPASPISGGCGLSSGRILGRLAWQETGCSSLVLD